MSCRPPGSRSASFGRALLILAAFAAAVPAKKRTQYEFPVKGYVHARWEQALAGDGAPGYGFVLRRARLKFRHSFVEQVRTELEVGFDEFEPELKDALVEYRPLSWLGFRAGLGKTGFSREELTPVSDLLFAERGIANGAFGDRGYLGRDIGLAVTGEFGRAGIELGAYNGNRARISRDDNNAKQFSERLTFSPSGGVELGLNATQRNDSLTGDLVMAFGADAGLERGPVRAALDVLIGEAEPGTWMLGGSVAAGYRIGAVEPKLRVGRLCPDIGEFGTGQTEAGAGFNWFLHRWLNLKTEVSALLSPGEDATIGLLVEARSGF